MNAHELADVLRVTMRFGILLLRLWSLEVIQGRRFAAAANPA